VDADPLIVPPADDDFEPSQPPRRGRLRRFFVPLVALVAVLVVPLAALGIGPRFHRDRLPVGGPLEGRLPAVAAAAAEQEARRLVTAASAVHAALQRVGPWEASFTERELNAWLALDLTRNHAALAGDWARDARVELLPGRLRAGCRMGRWSLSTVAWIEAEIRLRAANQLAITIADARLGLVPIPRGPILQALARRLDSLGMVSEIRRLEATNVLVVYIPSTHEAGGASHWLESLLLASGEVAIAGETRRGSPAGR
jgi:hypothetical protein